MRHQPPAGLPVGQPARTRLRRGHHHNHLQERNLRSILAEGLRQPSSRRGPLPGRRHPCAAEGTTEPGRPAAGPTEGTPVMQGGPGPCRAARGHPPGAPLSQAPHLPQRSTDAKRDALWHPSAEIAEVGHGDVLAPAPPPAAATSSTWAAGGWPTPTPTPTPTRSRRRQARPRLGGAGGLSRRRPAPADNVLALLLNPARPGHAGHDEAEGVTPSPRPVTVPGRPPEATS
jgi:hypothetical protein